MNTQEDRFLKESALLNEDPELVKRNTRRLIEARQKGPEALREEIVKLQAEAKSRNTE